MNGQGAQFFATLASILFGTGLGVAGVNHWAAGLIAAALFCALASVGSRS